jgi:hypothetical protein
MCKLFFLVSLFIGFHSFLTNTRVTSISKLYLLHEIDEFNELNEFYEFQEKFNKKYHSFNELEKRFNIFSKNLRSIILHNLDVTQNFTMTINEFTDLTSEEFTCLQIDKDC